MKRLLTFDDNGFYIGEEIVEYGTPLLENQYLAEINEEISFYKPKLVNGILVEGKTEEEFLQESLITALIPSQDKLDEADFEIKVITLLSELGVIGQ